MNMVTLIPEEITFRIIKDEDGMFCASSIDEQVYTFGNSLDTLWDNIKDVIECYFEIQYSKVTINLQFEAQK